jgi:hypothetical protein
MAVELVDRLSTLVAARRSPCMLLTIVLCALMLWHAFLFFKLRLFPLFFLMFGGLFCFFL